jgi:hypothetical protein
MFGLAPQTEAIDRLRVTVGDTTGASGEQNSVVSVFLTNTQDDISAFTVHLTLARNDIAHFKTSLDTVVDTLYWICPETEPIGCGSWVEVFDPVVNPWDSMNIDGIDTSYWYCPAAQPTVCGDGDSAWDAVDDPLLYPWDSLEIDSVEAYQGNLDIAGSLISDWEVVESRAVSTGDYGLDILVSAISDQTPSPPLDVLPISPQNGGLLFRILADIFEIPPEQEDRTVAVQIDQSWKPYFVFSTPEGEAIGWVSVPTPDTNYYMCTLPDPGGCGEWTHVPEWQCPNGDGSLCDSMRVDTVDVAVLDDTQVSLFDGSITVESWVCGDITGEGNVSIGDVSLMIDHLFINQEPLANPAAGNVNCSTEVPVVLTIGDLTALIDHLFISQLPLCCE